MKKSRITIFMLTLIITILATSCTVYDKYIIDNEVKSQIVSMDTIDNF